MAVLHARGLLGPGGGLTYESIIGSRFHGRIVEEVTVAGRKAIVPTVTGRAWITGYHHYIVDAEDPWPSGYVVADTWGTSGTTRQ
jgi:proline racemase